MNLALPSSVRSELLDGQLDAGSVYYGRCRDTYWAVGTVTGDLGTEFYAFKRPPSSSGWENLGGTSDPGTFCRVPRAMLRAWQEPDRNFCEKYSSASQ